MLLHRLIYPLSPPFLNPRSYFFSILFTSFILFLLRFSHFLFHSLSYIFIYCYIYIALFYSFPLYTNSFPYLIFICIFFSHLTNLLLVYYLLIQLFPFSFICLPLEQRPVGNKIPRLSLLSARNFPGADTQWVRLYLAKIAQTLLPRDTRGRDFIYRPRDSKSLRINGR
jgi:hypothetical protein